MTSKEEQITTAAIRIFARYGGKRSTMEDVATEAAVSRQTLYRMFPNKDALVRATIRYYVEVQWRNIHDNWLTSENLSDKLDTLFEQMVIVAWTVVNQSPDASELEKGFSDAGREEIQRCSEISKSHLSELFKSHKGAQNGQDCAADDLANFVYAAMAGIKDDARDLKQLKVHVSVLKTAVLALVD